MSTRESDEQADIAYRRTPLLVCLAAAGCGVMIGTVTNAIDGFVCRDYFALLMDWDWQAAPYRAIEHGAIEGAVLGLLFGVAFATSAAASARMRCPLRLALRALVVAMFIAIAGWIFGGIAAMVFARFDPRLFGFVFVVPSRVDHMRFAWVGGSIWGVYAGTAIGLAAAAIDVHVLWRRRSGGRRGFAIDLPGRR